MSRSTTRMGALGAALATLAAAALLAPPARAAIAPGDILIGEIAPATGDGAVIRVDPLTGKQTLLSSNATAVNLGSSEFLEDPYGITVSPSGAILVADEVADGTGPGSTGSLIQIDADTGKQTLLAANSLPGPDLFLDPIDVAFVPGIGNVVSDYSAFTGNDGGLIKVVSSTQSVLSSNDQTVNTGSSELFDDPNGVALTHSGGLVVADNGASLVIAVNPSTGKQSVVSSNAQPVNSSSMLLATPYGIEVEPSGRLVVADSNAFSSLGGVIGIDPATGKQSVVSSNEQPVNMGSSELFTRPQHLGRLLDGDLAVANEDSPGYVVRVDRPTGKQNVLSSNAQPVNAGSMLFNDPYALTVVPPKCFGFFATIYGSAGPDVLQASPFPDVIAGQGGDDKIIGLGQGDYLCGDAGRDRLVGSAGADRLAGGPGRDLLLGGGAKDTLLGGPGRDRLRGGPGRDKLRGGPGGDVLRGGPGRDVIRGGPGRDRERQ